VLSYAQRLRGVSKEKEGHQAGGLSLFRSEGTQLRLFARETRIATGHFDSSQDSQYSQPDEGMLKQQSRQRPPTPDGFAFVPYVPCSLTASVDLSNRPVPATRW
jgi:hypothetical protein